MYTLGTAAKATGLAKSTIHRAIKLGKISARSKDGNGYEIDPAELHRVYPAVSSAIASNPSLNRSAEPPVERYATREANPSNPEATPVARLEREHALEVQLARAEAQLEALKELLAAERKRAEEIREERDRWAGMAEASQRQLVDMSTKPKRGIMGFLRKA